MSGYTMKKIAVVVARPVQSIRQRQAGSTIQYSLFARNNSRTDCRTTAVLLYDDKTIEEFLSEVEVTFGIQRQVRATVVRPPDTIRQGLYVNAALSGNDTLCTVLLGAHADRLLYLVYFESGFIHNVKPKLTNFRVHSVPRYGRQVCEVHNKLLVRSFDANDTSVGMTHTLGEYTQDQLADVFNTMHNEIVEWSARGGAHIAKARAE